MNRMQTKERSVALLRILEKRPSTPEIKARIVWVKTEAGIVDEPIVVPPPPIITETKKKKMKLIEVPEE